MFSETGSHFSQASLRITILLLKLPNAGLTSVLPLSLDNFLVWEKPIFFCEPTGWWAEGGQCQEQVTFRCVCIYFWGPCWNTVELSYEVRASITTLSGLGNGKLLEDAEVWGSRILQVVVDSTYTHYLMTDTKVDYITTQKPKLLLVFGMAGKLSIPRLVHRNPHALVPTMSSPWEGVCCGPRDDWKLGRKLSSLGGLISRDWDRGVAEDRSLRTYQSRSNFP